MSTPSPALPTAIYWFRNDLRLHDQPGLGAALAASAGALLAVFCLPPADAPSPWGFPRMGSMRRHWLEATLADLQQQLAGLGLPLLVCHASPASVLPRLSRACDDAAIYCEEIAAPEEQDEVAALRAAGIVVHTTWQSSLLDPATLPWAPECLPGSFTPFRQQLEGAGVVPAAPLPAPAALALIPAAMPAHALAGIGSYDWQPASSMPIDPRSSVGTLQAGERAALRQLERYLNGPLVADYKRTRNQLAGPAFSSKWSIWLASGTLSARQIYAALKQHEASYGASDGSYWLWFELLWRDYFRLLHLQHGRKLYRAGGLSRQPVPPHDSKAYARWRLGETGVALVDAAMRELQHSGYLSNRLRQVVASYWLNEMQGDWRAGAAWFEACLLDYDVYSNQGNWLYIAGRGSDPRGGRHFNIDKQTAEHDADGSYRRLWGAQPD